MEPKVTTQLSEAEIILDRLEGYIQELKKTNWNNPGWFGALAEVTWFLNQERMRLAHPDQLEAKPVGQDHDNTYVVQPVQDNWPTFSAANGFQPAIIAPDIVEKL